MTKKDYCDMIIMYDYAHIRIRLFKNRRMNFNDIQDKTKPFSRFLE